MSQINFLDIKMRTIAKICLAVVLLFVLFQIQSVLIWFVFALIVSILFNFVIDALERKRIPRLVSSTLLYFGVFILIGFGIYKAGPMLLNETLDFYNNLPAYLKKISPIFEKFGIDTFKNSKVFIEALKINLDQATGSLGDALASIFGSALATGFIFAVAFFISLEKNFIERMVSLFVLPKHQDYAFSLWRRARKKVSGWFISRLIGVVFVGGAMSIIFLIFNVKYAVLLALLAGLLDFLPIFGPIVAGILMFTVVSLNSFYQAVFVVIAFVIIQELENKLLFPVLFKKFIGISPILVLVSFEIGRQLWGAAGGILAIPMAGVIYEVVKDYLNKRRQANEKEIETVEL
ncbi:MAG: AI-2E family transporter [Candidatus Gribaldobacteria bacterium]|nr:AI-2E family transporter [Candidatus Gribaldobacteria bacterium]